MQRISFSLLPPHLPPPSSLLPPPSSLLPPSSPPSCLIPLLAHLLLFILLTICMSVGKRATCIFVFVIALAGQVWEELAPATPCSKATEKMDMVAIDVLHDCSHCDWTLCSMDLVIYIPGRRNEDIRFQQDPMIVFRARVYGVVFLKACHQVSRYMKLYRRLGGLSGHCIWHVAKQGGFCVGH